MMKTTVQCTYDKPECNASGYCTWNDQNNACEHNPISAKIVKTVFPLFISPINCPTQTTEAGCAATGLFCAWDAAEKTCTADMHALDGIQACKDPMKCPELQKLTKDLQPLAPIVSALADQSRACAAHGKERECEQDDACMWTQKTCMMTEESIAQTVGMPITRVLPAHNFTPDHLDLLSEVLRM